MVGVTPGFLKEFDYQKYNAAVPIYLASMTFDEQSETSDGYIAERCYFRQLPSVIGNSKTTPLPLGDR